MEEAAREGVRPKLLLQSCCGPCSSYVLSYLAPRFEIFLYYFNPNIYPAEEYVRRLDTQKSLLGSACFALRLEQTAKKAAETGMDMFGTTLTVSPHKNAAVINEIGCAMEKKYGVAFLRSDFKKKDGYKKSITLSEEYGLYRQNYCGCEFSIRANG